ncbi:MAG: efflux RND transporter periplasmic adaptor subunit [Paludisphaera borealis]|uniref:efflux RND transporter periplasmic adaptor subunit n=1 Tax=Paludisphaera borealis TaxID=1387353 RepID=UPI0028472263|nr:efflux RND transporter periplasmic adaptor subunit [Paludisphaera borealis]MDR3621209.1 efflux RND transporter periplasmic adaptor subunit [Paludisphaera borealis]
MQAIRLSPLLVGVLLSTTLTGCARRPPRPAPAEPSAIPVSKPITRQITDYVDFTGRTEAVQSVDIRPRTTGYLVKMPFTEGSDVKAGDLLFEIDPRPYQAQLDQAQGQVNLYQAQLKLARTTYARDRAINRITPNAVSDQQLDQDVAALDEADARVKAYEKNMEVYRLNHEFTRVVSPIAGMVSRYYLTLGNLVNQDQTLLTTIVSLDPMYAYFDLDEPTMLRIRRAINEGRLKSRASGIRLPLYMGLQGEPGYPHEGEIDFVNNQLNPTTGSILVRGVFANPKPQTGVRLLSPGMFVRIRLPIGQPHPAVLVIDRAISSDQGIKYVYVIDEKNIAQYRKVTTGSLQDDGLRVITSGLTADEWVVVGGLQQVQPKTAVKPEPTAMPSLDSAESAETPPSAIEEPTPSEKAKPAPKEEAKPAPKEETREPAKSGAQAGRP